MGHILRSTGAAKVGRCSGKKNVVVSLRALTLCIFLAVLSALPATSWGHAFPDHSDPKVGSTVTGSPSMVRIWFDGDLEPAFSTIMVHNLDGKMVDRKDGRVDTSNPKLLEVGVPTLPPGQYLVIWNVVARDGHRTTGQFTFTVK